MFRKESDYEVLERVMIEARLRQPIHILSYCVRSSSTVAVGQPLVEDARHGCDQSFVTALAAGTAGELEGSRQRSFDDERI